MKVRALDAEMHDPEVFAQRGCERRFADRLVGEPAAQVADRSDDAQDDMHRMPRESAQAEPCAVSRPACPWAYDRRAAACDRAC